MNAAADADADANTGTDVTIATIAMSEARRERWCIRTASAVTNTDVVHAVVIRASTSLKQVFEQQPQHAALEDSIVMQSAAADSSGSAARVIFA